MSKVSVQRVVLALGALFLCVAALQFAGLFVPAHLPSTTPARGVEKHVVWRTCRSLRTNLAMVRKCHDAWLEDEAVTMHWFDDAAVEAFMRTQPTRDRVAFAALRPGAFKSDVFRLCLLRERGGVYIDAHCTPIIKLSQILEDCTASGTHFVSVLDSAAGGGGVHNGFMAASRGHPFLEACLRRISENVTARAYFKNNLEITGPLCLQKAMAGVVGNGDFHEGWNAYGHGLSFYLMKHHFGPRQRLSKAGVSVAYKKYNFAVYFAKSAFNPYSYAHMCRRRVVYV